MRGSRGAASHGSLPARARAQRLGGCFFCRLSPSPSPLPANLGAARSAHSRAATAEPNGTRLHAKITTTAESWLPRSAAYDRPSGAYDRPSRHDFAAWRSTTGRPAGLKTKIKSGRPPGANSGTRRGIVSLALLPHVVRDGARGPAILPRVISVACRILPRTQDGVPSENGHLFVGQLVADGASRSWLTTTRPPRRRSGGRPWSACWRTDPLQSRRSTAPI